MDIKNSVDVGRLLTIAGMVITVLGSLVESKQQEQMNHEIAREVAALVRAEMKEVH